MTIGELVQQRTYHVTGFLFNSLWPIENMAAVYLGQGEMKLLVGVAGKRVAKRTVVLIFQAWIVDQLWLQHNLQRFAVNPREAIINGERIT